MMNHLQIKDSRKISITFRDNSIELKNADKIIPVNLDLNSWGKQFDEAFKVNGKPEKLVWPEMSEDSETLFAY